MIAINVNLCCMELGQWLTRRIWKGCSTCPGEVDGETGAKVEMDGRAAVEILGGQQKCAAAVNDL